MLIEIALTPYLPLVIFNLTHVADIAPARAAVDSATFNVQADSNQASFVLEGHLKPQSAEAQELKLIYTAEEQIKVQVDPKLITTTCELKTRIAQGKLTELALAITGDGEVTHVTGENLRDWSVRVV